MGLGRHPGGERELSSPSVLRYGHPEEAASFWWWGWRQSCLAAVAGKNTPGKSLFSDLYSRCMGVASAHITARTRRHPFAPPQPHCSRLLLCGCCWLGGLLEASGLSQREGHSRLHGAGCQGGLRPPWEESGWAGCCHLPHQVLSPRWPPVALLCLAPSPHGSFSSLWRSRFSWKNTKLSKPNMAKSLSK